VGQSGTFILIGSLKGDLSYFRLNNVLTKTNKRCQCDHTSAGEAIYSAKSCHSYECRNGIRNAKAFMPAPAGISTRIDITMNPKLEIVFAQRLILIEKGDP